MLVYNMQKAVFNRALSLDIFEHEIFYYPTFLIMHNIHSFNKVLRPYDLYEMLGMQNLNQLFHLMSLQSDKRKYDK